MTVKTINEFGDGTPASHRASLVGSLLYCDSGVIP
jgi:hypothetical protein